jgi:hypothetical protein
MTLPAWNEITTSDEWKTLDPQQQRTVYKSYLKDLGQTDDWKSLASEDKFKVVRAIETDAGFYTPTKKEGLYEGLMKPIAKAIPKVVGHTAATVFQAPVSGLAAGAKFITSKGDLNAANKVLEDNQKALDDFYLTNEAERKGSQNIGLAMKPFEMAGEGWREIGKLTGIPYAEPILGTMGEASAIFGFGGAGKAAKARVNQAMAPLEGIIPKTHGKPYAVSPEVPRQVDPAYVRAAFEREQPLALPDASYQGQGANFILKPKTILEKGYTVGKVNPDLIVENVPYRKRGKIQNATLEEAQPTPPVKPAFHDALDITTDKPTLDFVLSEMKSDLQRGEAGGLKGVDDYTGEKTYLKSGHSQWYQDLASKIEKENKLAKKKGEPELKIDKKYFINIIDKGLKGEKLTPKQTMVWERLNKIADTETHKTYAPLVDNFRKANIERPKGYEPAESVEAYNLNKGDKLIRNGEEFKVVDEKDGSLIIKDGETLTVPLDETIKIDGIKKTPKGDFENTEIPGAGYRDTWDLTNPETEISKPLPQQFTPKNVTLFGGIPGIAQFSQMSKAIANTRPARKLAAFFNPELGVPEGRQWMYSRQKAKGTAALGEKFADEFVKKYNYLKPEERMAIWEWMDKGTDINSLPQNLQKPAMEFKGIDNAMGKFAVANKLMSKETFDANPNHIRYIYNIHQTGGDFFSGMGQKVNKKFLAERKDLTDPQRAELGLIKDPVQAIATSIGDTYRAVGMSKHFNKIANNPNYVFSPTNVMVDGVKMGIGKVQKTLDLYNSVEKHGMKLNTEQVAYRDKLQTALKDVKAIDVPKDYIQINGSQYGALDGQFVRKEIAQDIKPILDGFKTTSPTVNKIVAGIAAANGLWKMKSVALNIPTAARNTISNPSQLMMSGMRPDTVVVRFTEAISELVKDGKYKNEALREGVFKTNFAEGELQEIVQLAKTFDKDNWVDFLSKVQSLGKYYGKIDDTFKLAKFIDQRKLGKSTAEAAYEANKWGMDYSLAHPSIKTLRNSPIGAPFISYQYKIAPLIAESLYKRPWVIGSIFALPYLVQQVVTQDMTDEEATRYIDSLPEYVKNKQVFLIPGTHGMNALDVSYMVPWGNWYQIADSVHDAKVSKAFKQLGVASGLMPSLLYGVTTGKDLFTGKEIVSPENNYNKKAAAWDITKWMWQQAAPPMMTETSVAGKVSEHLQHGQTKQAMKTEGMNVWPRIAGVNIYPVDPSGGAKSKQYEIKNVRKAIISKLYNRNISPQERQALMEAYRMAVGKITRPDEEEESEDQGEI